MNKDQRLITLRMHKLGVLLYDARLATRRSIEECATAIGVSPETFESFEAGETAPSLPQLEALAFFLDLPIEHFWDSIALSESQEEAAIQDADRLAAIRNRIIGTRVQMLRNELNMSLDELSKATSLPIERLQTCEDGQSPISLPELEVIAVALGTRVETFIDDRGVIGAWRTRQITIQKFFDLPEQHQQFILQPVNRPYLELAMRLSELSVEKLRGVAEGLLEITY
jgi:transcriptional regulator with XRE-family HTH domain